MKILIRIALILILMGCSSFFAKTANAEMIDVTIPTFKVTLDDEVMNNWKTEYPCLVYRNLTYFPMTLNNARAMGLDIYYNVREGLFINQSPKPTDEKYEPYYNVERQNRPKYNALLPTYPIYVNGSLIDNSQEPFPIFNFRGITYFPLSWHYCVNEFGWKYKYTREDGLRVTSTRVLYKPKKKEPSDYSDRHTVYTDYDEEHGYLTGFDRKHHFIVIAKLNLDDRAEIITEIEHDADFILDFPYVYYTDANGKDKKTLYVFDLRNKITHKIVDIRDKKNKTLLENVLEHHFSTDTSTIHEKVNKYREERKEELRNFVREALKDDFSKRHQKEVEKTEKPTEEKSEVA